MDESGKGTTEGKAKNSVEWSLSSGERLSSASQLEKKMELVSPKSRIGMRKQTHSKDWSRKSSHRGETKSKEVSHRGAGNAMKISDFRARYWSYLFDNLHRAVDEIYCMCETDRSVIECQEMIMMLEVCRKDFEALIRRFELQKEYEKNEREGRSTNSLAWEVKKSPSKAHSTFHSYIAEQERADQQRDDTQPDSPTCSSTTSQQISHNSPPRGPVLLSASARVTNSASGTWADRVRGYSLPAQNKPESGEHTCGTGTGEHGTESGEHTCGTGTGKHGTESGEHTCGTGTGKHGTESGEHTCGTGTGKHGTEASKSGTDSGEHKTHAQSSVQSNESQPGVLRKQPVSCVCKNESNDAKNYEGEKNKRNADLSSSENGTRNSVPTPITTLENEPEEKKDLEKESKETTDETTCTTKGQPLEATRDSDMKQKDTETVSSFGIADSESQQPSTTPSKSKATPTLESWSDMLEEYEEEMNRDNRPSWADRCDSPPRSSPGRGEFDFSEQRETRSPGRAVQLHQKLSSPLRKKSTEDCIKTMEEKQVKAELFRVKKKEEMALKSKSISDKIREFQQSRNTITIQKKEAMEVRLERAEKLRVSHLQEIVRKAQEEDVKVNEIAFINSLEAQNKKIEVLERHHGVEARLQDRQEERQKKIEENQAKEEAAQERRKALEAERKAKLKELDQKRKEQDAKFEQMKQEKGKAREEAAKERERKMEARHAALLLSAEELEKKIQLKHDESSRRYDQHLEQKKEKAVWRSMSRHSSTDYAPRVEAYQKKKWCSVCKVKIVSEVYLMSHLKGKKHKECLLANGVAEEQPDVIVLAPDDIQRQTVSMEVQERMKVGKKRAKKLRQKMSSRVRESELLLHQGAPPTTSKHHQRFSKLIKDINRYLDGPSPLQTNHYEKALTELNRILGSKVKDDQSSFCQLGGLTSLSRFLLLHLDQLSHLSLSQKRPMSQTIPEKPLHLTLSVLELACTNHFKNSQHLILSNKFVPIVDLAARYFAFQDHQTPPKASPPHPRAPSSSPDSSPPRPPDAVPSSRWSLDKTRAGVCGSLFNVMAVVISSLVEQPLGETEQLCLKDCISYVVCVGLIDQLAEYFRSITGPFEDMTTAQVIISGLNMLLSFTAILHFDIRDVFDQQPQDQTQLIAVLRQTDLAGILSLVYALLLHDGPPRHSFVPPTLPPHILSITAAAVRTINNASILGLRVVQSCLGAEGISLEFRHILSYLLWYCTHHHHDPLLHELILAVGYFSVLNRENQMFLLAGRTPTLLQLLCGLPFEYFSDPKLENLLYPTLIASCYNIPESKDVLKLEVNCKLLCVYIKTKLEEKEKKSTMNGDVQDFLSFKYRFPEGHWKSAIAFFTEHFNATN